MVATIKMNWQHALRKDSAESNEKTRQDAEPTPAEAPKRLRRQRGITVFLIE